MRRWSDEGLIAKRRGRYVILEMGGLEKKSVGSSFGLAHRSRPIV
jgi:hypothetical protein